MHTLAQLDQAMVTVTGGTYAMGNSAYPREQPLHDVVVQDFEICKYIVTQDLWTAVMGDNPSHFQDDGQCPVEQVSWQMAMEFVTKLGALTGLPYRLPTENEWEYAARGGNLGKGFARAGSDDLQAVAWYNGNSGFKTHPVGRKAPNELGLYDMIGNVWEWCADVIPKDYANPHFEPTAAALEASDDRILRGGSYINYAVFCRNTYRWEDRPDNIENYIGLRLARSIKA
jgi:formylglycine-generating enzyme required for sulfatase activity